MYYGCKLKKSDKRYKKFARQRKIRGFDDTETWNLDRSICEFIIPRLKRFKELNNGFPIGSTKEEWDIKLDKMIEGFEASLKLDEFSLDYIELYKKMKSGLKLFTQHFRSLWW